MRKSPEYGIWCDIKKRCHTQSSHAYADYGGRGIRVCERWRTDFAQFFADMGPRPSADRQIDRIDNDGNYEPGNCRWATRIEQARNKRNNVFLTHWGRRLTIAEWAEETGFTDKQIQSRLKLGWSHRRALTEPLRADHRRTGR